MEVPEYKHQALTALLSSWFSFLMYCLTAFWGLLPLFFFQKITYAVFIPFLCFVVCVCVSGIRMSFPSYLLNSFFFFFPVKPIKIIVSYDSSFFPFFFFLLFSLQSRRTKAFYSSPLPLFIAWNGNTFVRQKKRQRERKRKSSGHRNRNERKQRYLFFVLLHFLISFSSFSCSKRDF